MQNMRWKGLMDSKVDSNQSISKDKPKKYTPTRNITSSQLNKKIKAAYSSKLNNSSEMSIPHKEQQSGERSFILKRVENSSTQNLSPKRSGSDLNLQSKLKPFTSPQPLQQLASPTVLIKQMNQIKKRETPKYPTKALFSLDQEHKYIHEQLFKIKTDFSKFKQIMMEELIRYRKEIDSIVNKIMTHFQEVLQACSSIQHLPISIFDQPNHMRDSAKFNAFENMELESLNISIIKKQSSVVGESKAELKKIFGEQSSKFDKMLSNKANQFSTERSKPYQAAKTERVQPFRPFNPNSISPKATKHRQSKRQFQKLFQAVNSLKRDMKDLNEMSSEGTKKEVPIHSSHHHANINGSSREKVKL